jgi:transcriptional regulator with XRE-family HTH domain
MISTHVRRLRLAQELSSLRDQAAISSQELADDVGLPRTTVSRLENGRMRPDPDDVMQILERLGVQGDAWKALMIVAREASERGWWESSVGAMGRRQALYANLEAGAAHIREYQMALLPGLLQTAEFTRTRTEIDVADWSQQFLPQEAVKARAGRQRMLHRPDGPQYEVIIDEVAVRRPAADHTTFREQLLHIAMLARENPKICVRVLPLERPIADYHVPRSSFSIYRYPDPLDPVVVAVDTVTDDLILTEESPVGHYETHYAELSAAALDPSESVLYLRRAAEQLPHLTGQAA